MVQYYIGKAGCHAPTTQAYMWRLETAGGAQTCPRLLEVSNATLLIDKLCAHRFTLSNPQSDRIDLCTRAVGCGAWSAHSYFFASVAPWPRAFKCSVAAQAQRLQEELCIVQLAIAHAKIKLQLNSENRRLLAQRLCETGGPCLTPYS